jgi:hypothetical protein
MVTKLVQRILLAFLLAVVGGAMVRPTDASAETMTWKVLSNYKYKIQVAFYSQTRSHEWPGAGDAYNLNDSETHEYPISCQDGEKVCIGGWVTGNAKKYWGVGYNNKNGCKACCYVCGGGPIPRQVLD